MHMQGGAGLQDNEEEIQPAIALAIGRSLGSLEIVLGASIRRAQSGAQEAQSKTLFEGVFTAACRLTR